MAARESIHCFWKAGKLKVARTLKREVNGRAGKACLAGGVKCVGTSMKSESTLLQATVSPQLIMSRGLIDSATRRRS